MKQDLGVVAVSDVKKELFSILSRFNGGNYRIKRKSSPYDMIEVYRVGRTYRENEKLSKAIFVSKAVKESAKTELFYKKDTKLILQILVSDNEYSVEPFFGAGSCFEYSPEQKDQFLAKVQDLANQIVRIWSRSNNLL